MEWNTRQKELFAQYARFGRQEVAPRAQQLARDNQFDQQSWNALATTDFWKLVTPREFGGYEPNWWDFSAALEGLASTAADGGFLLSAIAQAGLIHGLSQIGTPAQQAIFFPRLLDGESSALGIAEPQSGTDTSNLQTTATPTEKGYQLSGHKFNIAHAPTAGTLVILGRIPSLGKKDLSLFLFDGNLPGIQRGAAESKMGNRTLPTSWLKFEGVSLNEDHLFGPPGEGLRSLGSMVLIDRIYYGWMGAMLVRPVLEEAKNFIAGRNSFGRSLKDHQYVQQKVTDILMGMARSRWTGMACLEQVLSGNPAAIPNSSVAKLTGIQSMLQSTRDLVALMGSRGYQSGTASHLAQDALGWISVGGTEETHRINLFNQFMRNNLPW